ncbi:phosphatidylinositol-binding protein scs2, partial [Coemansia biformis]
PFKALTNATLVLTNKNNGPAAFKVKTTAPKMYCVRPNAGRIEPGDSINIQISLQPMKEEPPADFKCRDKFLIQSIQISPEMESMPMTELWAMVEREAKSSISEKKLRVRYLPALVSAPEMAPTADTAPAEPAVDAAAAAANRSPPTDEKAVAAAAPAHQPRISPTARALPGPSPLAKSVDSYDEQPPTDADEKATTAPPPAHQQPQADADQQRPQTASNRLFPESSAPSPADTSALAYQTDSAPNSPRDDSPTHAELEAAKTTIEELRRQLAEYKVQMEKRPLAATTVRMPRTSDTIDGLSMQSVAIVALVAFLVGYFFF